MFAVRPDTYDLIPGSQVNPDPSCFSRRSDPDPFFFLEGGTRSLMIIFYSLRQPVDEREYEAIDI